jgi:hypothetical protein
MLLTNQVKRQRTGALQDAARISNRIVPRVGVLGCGGPPPLFPAHTKPRTS